VSQKKDMMMKKTLVSVIVGIMLYVLAVGLSGCTQPGETAAEGHRRHLRNLSLNQQELVRDTDNVLLSDEPSKLTDKRMP
jgi:hypothetical protein